MDQAMDSGKHMNKPYFHRRINAFLLALFVIAVFMAPMAVHAWYPNMYGSSQNAYLSPYGFGYAPIPYSYPFGFPNNFAFTAPSRTFYAYPYMPVQYSYLTAYESTYGQPYAYSPYGSPYGIGYGAPPFSWY